MKLEPSQLLKLTLVLQQFCRHRNNMRHMINRCFNSSTMSHRHNPFRRTLRSSGMLAMHLGLPWFFRYRYFIGFLHSDPGGFKCKKSRSMVQFGWSCRGQKQVWSCFDRIQTLTQGWYVYSWRRGIWQSYEGPYQCNYKFFIWVFLLPPSPIHNS